jgi:cellobiose transport system permease protein
MTTTSPAATRAPARKSALSLRQRLNRADVKYSPYVYVAPFFILFGLVGLFPLIYTFVVSLNDWDLLSGAGDWIGFDNYVTELTNPWFWNSLGNTFSIFVLSAVPQLIAATFIAAVLDQNLRGKTFWRLSVLLPYVVTPVAVTLIFSSAFSEQYGLINNFLGTLGIDPIMWKHDTLPGHFAVATMVNWRWTGYNALILLAALQSVPRDLYDAAAIDGANRFRQFTSISIPQIKPTVIFVVITSTIGGLQIFAEPRMFDSTLAQNGGSDRQFGTMTMLIYDFGWHLRDLGRASATAWLLFLLIIVIALGNYVLSRRFGTLSKHRRRR